MCKLIIDVLPTYYLIRLYLPTWMLTCFTAFKRSYVTSYSVMSKLFVSNDKIVCNYSTQNWNIVQVSKNSDLKFFWSAVVISTVQSRLGILHGNCYNKKSTYFIPDINQTKRNSQCDNAHIKYNKLFVMLTMNGLRPVTRILASFSIWWFACDVIKITLLQIHTRTRCGKPSPRNNRQWPLPWSVQF